MSITGSEFNHQYPGQMIFISEKSRPIGLTENHRHPFLIWRECEKDFHVLGYHTRVISYVVIPDDAQVTFGWSDGLPSEERISTNKMIIVSSTIHTKAKM